MLDQPRLAPCRNRALTKEQAASAPAEWGWRPQGSAFHHAHRPLRAAQLPRWINRRMHAIAELRCRQVRRNATNAVDTECSVVLEALARPAGSSTTVVL